MPTPPRLRNDCFSLPPGVDWTPVDQALEQLRSGLSPVVGTETVDISNALSRILSKHVTAARANPATANCAVDGYGFDFASAKTGTTALPLISGRAAAGVPFVGSVPKGQAIRILTGAQIPEGVDTVVLEEDVNLENGVVHFRGGLKQGANTRQAGEDVKFKDILFDAGHKLAPQDLALIAATGTAKVEVRKVLRVGVLSTGDELQQAGEPATSAEVYDANRPMLLGLLRRWNFEAVDLGHAKDDLGKLRAHLNHAAETVDAILTSGGASAGDEDHVSALLQSEGSLHNWRIALKPGRPLALGLWQGVPIFGLPGNPVAAFVCALIFSRPALAVLAGGIWTSPQGFKLPAGFAKSKKSGRREYLRARIDKNGQAEVFASEGSGRISGLSWADGLVELADHAQEIQSGDPVKYLPFSEFGL